MKFLLLFFIFNTTILDIPIISAYVDQSGDYYEHSIDGYKKNEFWGNWAMPLSRQLKSSSTKATSGKYPIQ